MTQKSKTRSPKSGQRRAEKPVDDAIRGAGEHIGYVPTRSTEPCPPPPSDRELHSQLLGITSRISEILAMIEMWNDSPKHCEVASLFEQLSELNLEVWRVRWEGTLSDHVVAS